jgi:hypothetical protein
MSATGLPPSFWEDRFQAQTTPWERDGLNPAFLAWRAAGVLSPCRILVPGAGRSQEPVTMLADGFDVITVDLAETAVVAQRHALGERRVVQADVTTWQPSRGFDAIYDQTCLCALPPSLWPAYVAQLQRWLRPHGALFILFMQTGREGGPPFDCNLPAMRSLFAGWNWPDTLEAPVPQWNTNVEQPVILRPRA